MELLPCPFCGSNNIAIRVDTVCCRDCNAMVSEHTEDDAIKAWNTRASLPLDEDSVYKDLYYSTFLAGHFKSDDVAKDFIRGIAKRITQRFAPKSYVPSVEEIINTMKLARIKYEKDSKEFWNSDGEEYSVATAINRLLKGQNET